MDQIKEFKKSIEEVTSLVKGFKENNVLRKVEEYRKSIADIKETLLKLSNELKEINMQQVHLDHLQEEYPQIDELK
jgi:ADP-dependent phosphofructokinase/glucokinase